MGGCLSGVPAYFNAKKYNRPVTMGYWKIRGLGAVPRMALEYVGAKYEDEQFGDVKVWFNERKPAILKMNPLANLPYLIDGDVCVCQTNSVLHYLGEKYNLCGDTPTARLQNDELLNEIYDVRNGMIDMTYPFHDISRDKAEFDAKATKLASSLPFSKFEELLSRRGTPFFCGNKPLTADFHIWEMLDQHKVLAERYGYPTALDAFPKCKAFHERFRALPQLEKYFASEDYRLPINMVEAGAYFY